MTVGLIASRRGLARPRKQGRGQGPISYRREADVQSCFADSELGGPQLCPLLGARDSFPALPASGCRSSQFCTFPRVHALDRSEVDSEESF